MIAMALAVGVALVSSEAARALPDDRSYELVSPGEKNGGDVAGVPTSTRAAAEGTAVSFLSLSGFADVAGAGLSFAYVSQRVAGRGWSTHAVQPRQDAQSANLATLFQQPQYWGEFSEDLSMGVFRALSPLTDAPMVDRTRNLYLRRDLRTPGAGTYELLTQSTSSVPPPGTNPNGNDYRPTLAAASDDFGHVLFESLLNLTDNAPSQPPECAESFGDCLPRLYEYDHGAVRLAGILPDGSAAASAAAGRGATGRLYTNGTISADGSRIFFTAPVNSFGRGTAGAQVYMREDAATTVRISETERTVPDPSGPGTAIFWGVADDGTRVFFTSVEQLTDDDQNFLSDLYMYDASRPATAPDNLSRLSIDQEPDDGLSAEVQSVIGVSDDGAYVYFVAQGQLVDGAPVEGSNTGLDDLYVWHQGIVRSIGYIQPLNSDQNAGVAAFPLGPQDARVTPDGTRMAFMSEDGAGLTGYDHGSACPDGAVMGCRQIYVFDAEANSGEGQVVCASCTPSGAPATSDAGTQFEVGRGGILITEHRNRFFSDDGSRVFFTTGERLVPEDTNGQTRDVYMYDVDRGDVELISAGKGTAGSYFMDASASGGDAFFVTRDHLVGWDVDDNYDLYDARVGSGLPEPAPSPLGCGGDPCQGPLDLLPGAFSPETGLFKGKGSSGGSTPTFAVVPLTQRKLMRWSRSGKIILRVRVSEPGGVSARVRGRIGGRQRTLASAAIRARSGGVVRLRLQLSSAARRHLARGNALRVVIFARYSGQAGTQRVTATLSGTTDGSLSNAAATRGGGR